MPKRAPTEPKSSAVDAKRQTRRGKERTAEVLHAATELFLENGYERTSLDEIVQRSGGSKSHLYGAFGGKEPLLLAVVAALCDEVQLPVSSLVLTVTDVEKGLTELVRALITMLHGKRHLALQRLVFSEGARFPEVGELWFERGPKTTRRVFRRYIKNCMKAGTLRAGDAGLIAYQFEDLLSGHLLDCHWLSIGRAPKKREIAEVARAAVQLMLCAYGMPAEAGTGANPRKATD